MSRPRRAKRPSRWSVAKTNEPTPRLSSGDVAGEFTVLEYHGWSARHPITGHVYYGEHHWYNCQCSCGAKEWQTQQQLIDERRQRCCSDCSKEIEL